MIDVVIDGKNCSVEKGTTVLEAARNLGIHIPTICYHPGLPPSGNCRLCSVELREKGKTRIVMSCMYQLERSGLEIRTASERITKYRRFILEMLLRRCPSDPMLHKLAREHGITEIPRSSGMDNESCCILCGLCIRACEICGTSALGFIKRGWEKEVSTPFNEPSMDCTGCGACADVCPVNFIKMEDCEGTRTIWGRIFTLARCRICGKYFATFQQLERESGKEEPDLVCQKCRRAEEARIIGKAIAGN